MENRWRVDIYYSKLYDSLIYVMYGLIEHIGKKYTEGHREGLFMGRKDGYLFKNQRVPFSLHTVLKITRIERARKEHNSF